MASNSGIPGVYFLKERVGAPNPFGIRWKENNQPQTKWLPTEAIRAKLAKQIERERKLGLSASDREMSAEQVAEYRAIKTAIGERDWQHVISAGIKALDADVLPSRSVARSVREYMVDRESELDAGRLSDDYWRQLKSKMVIFREEFGEFEMGDVTTDDIREWLEDLETESPFTYNNYRKHVHAFYEFFGEQLKDYNPVRHVDKQTEVIEHVGILPIEDAARLFDYALKHAPYMLGRLPLEAFAGIRYSSAHRLEKNDIDFANRGIRLPAKKIKTKEREYIDGLPDNIWPWLERATDECWSITRAQYMHEKSKLFTDAGVPHPKNCLRHSFCTYHIKMNGDAKATQLILCQKSADVLFKHYKGVSYEKNGVTVYVTPEMGREYFKILPGS